MRRAVAEMEVPPEEGAGHMNAVSEIGDLC